MECTHGHHHLRHHHHHHDLAEGLPHEHVKRLRLVMGLSALYLVTLLIGGYFSGSIALLAEAGHKLGDTGALGLALIAAWFATIRHSSQKTFGYARMEIISALINGLLLVGVAGFVMHESIERFTGAEHAHVQGQIMLPVALTGLIINVISVRILHSFRETNLNVRGAYFHILADLLGSASTLTSALLILFFHWQWADAAFGVVIALLVLWNAVHILAEALHVLMESAPPSIDLQAVRGFIENLHGVLSVHDLHVWTITTGKDALLAHVVVEDGHFSHHTVESLESALRDEYGLCHITLQLEPAGFTEDEPQF